MPTVCFSIQWARKYGIRIYLDLHALPGSQNGWVGGLTLLRLLALSDRSIGQNHSGKSSYTSSLVNLDTDRTLNEPVQVAASICGHLFFCLS